MQGVAATASLPAASFLREVQLKKLLLLLVLVALGAAIAKKVRDA
jgi:hypothetical protein